MADTNTLKTRILLRNDITANREISTLVLLKGEAYIDYYTKTITNDDGTVSTIPQNKIYFGDGVTELRNLKPASFTPEETEQLVTDARNTGKLTIVEDTSDTNYAKQYKFYQGTKIEKQDDGNGNITETEVPDRLLGTISLLKDMVVSKAELLKVTQEDIDNGTYNSTNITVPSTYIALTIANSDNTVLYLDVKTLVNDYEAETGANEIQIMISEDHKISASVIKLKTSKLTDDPDCTLILDGGSSVQ